MGGGGGFQGRNTAADIPGQVSARKCDPVRTGAAHGEDRSDAPRPQGEPPGTFKSRRSPQEEDSWLTLLWGHGLRHSLG